ncbi:hypothetical protein HK105_201539 [Polyrhizophydium stewartii]|uniref:RRM domain-containing protein n=1 Tax=Polyrhizophydium stewartii TaxID=2732419 RepID=A0ABR4NGW8_9FUNG
MGDNAPVVDAGAAPGARWAHDPRVRLDDRSGLYVYTDEDGVLFEYDEARRAWFPRLNEALVQAQQSVYGTADPGEPTMTAKEKRKAARLETLASKRAKASGAAEQPGADGAADSAEAAADGGAAPKPEKKPQRNTAVYVTGLPPDATVDEIKQIFSKCGIILEDPQTLQPRIKMYKNEHGHFKGDALVIYFKEESVKLAIDLLDESAFRHTEKSTIRVQKAVFQEKPAGSTGDSAAKPKERKPKQNLRHKLENRLGWFEESQASAGKSMRAVILKHMFTLKELEEDPTLLLDLKEDVQQECSKFGEVTSVVLYDLEEDGIMLVRFKLPESAEACQKVMNGRFFGGVQVEATLSHGKEKFKQSKALTEEEEKKRIDAYEQWLESQH